MIEVDDLVRIRGVFEGDDKQLHLYNSSNLIIIPKSTYIYTDYEYRLFVNKKEAFLNKEQDLMKRIQKINCNEKSEEDPLLKLYSYQNFFQTFKCLSFPEFDISYAISIPDLRARHENLMKKIQETSGSLSLKEDDKEKKNEKYALLEASLLNVYPRSLKDGIKRGCKTCAIEEKFQKETCQVCKGETVVYYDFTIYLLHILYGNCVVKVKLNTLQDFNGEGIIDVPPEKSFFNLDLLENWLKKVTNPLIRNTYCINLLNWRIVGRYAECSSLSNQE